MNFKLDRKSKSTIIVIFFLIISFVGCKKHLAIESVSKVSYILNGRSIETFYAENAFSVESSRTGNNLILLNSDSEEGNLGFVVVSPSIIGDYTYTNSIPNDYTNRIGFHPPDADPFGYSSNNCTTPSFQISITNYYPGQETINGTFEGTVCDDSGNTIEITDGVF